MSNKTYKIINYILVALFVGSVIGFLVLLKVTKEMGVYPTLCLCLMLLDIVGIIVLQCFYRVTKKPFETKNQIKTCSHCNTINDIDAEYCKKCGKKFTDK